MMQNLLLTDFTSHILEKVHTLLKSHLFLEYFESILPFSQWNDTYLRIWVHQGQEIYLLCFLAIASSIVNEVVTFMLLEEKEMKGGQWGLVNFTFWPILYCGKRLFFIYLFFFMSLGASMLVWVFYKSLKWVQYAQKYSEVFFPRCILHVYNEGLVS